MSKLVARKKGVKRTVSIGKVAPETAEQVEDLNGRIEAIQWLIPLGLQAVAEELQRAVVELAGPRYQRKGSDQPLRRWGSQLGSVYLADQKLPVDVPRVRNVANHTEVPLDVYQALQTPRQMDEGLLLRMLKGIATRNYEACAEAVPEAFGLSSSSVSRRYVKGTARKLAEFQERSLEGYDLVALFLDGKSFADEEIIIALGVTLDGQKIPLGFVQAATENERVCRRFLSDLVERGMQYEAGLLVVIDGAKGLYKAVMSVLKGHACVQRCQYHKRQNVVSYLSKSEQSGMGRKMEAAYGKPRYEAAKAALDALKPGLKLMNQSALHSLEEGDPHTPSSRDGTNGRCTVSRCPVSCSVRPGLPESNLTATAGAVGQPESLRSLHLKPVRFEHPRQSIRHISGTARRTRHLDERRCRLQQSLPVNRTRHLL